MFRLHQQVALAAHRLDLQVTDGDRGELAPQVADVHVETAVEARVAAVQHAPVEERLAQRLASVFAERRQEAVFGWRQPRRKALVEHILGLVVEHQPGIPPLRRRQAVQSYTAQQGVGAGIQLGQAERLRQVVVGAAGEAADAILFGAQGRHQHHRRGLLAAQRLQQGQAVEAGQHDVQQHQVERFAPGGFQSVRAIAADGYAEAAPAEMRVEILA